MCANQIELLGNQCIGFGNCIVQGLLGRDAVEQRRLNCLQEDIVDILEFRNLRFDVGLVRDNVLGIRAGRIFDCGRLGRKERVIIRRRGRRIDGNLLGEFELALGVGEEEASASAAFGYLVLLFTDSAIDVGWTTPDLPSGCLATLSQP